MTKQEINEYDALGTASTNEGELVFIGEVKAHTKNQGFARLGSAKPTDDAIAYKLRPLAEYFERHDFGYIVASPAHVFSSGQQMQYSDHGILVVEFPIDKFKFKEEVEKAHTTLLTRRSSRRG